MKAESHVREKKKKFPIIFDQACELSLLSFRHRRLIENIQWYDTSIACTCSDICLHPHIYLFSTDYPYCTYGNDHFLNSSNHLYNSLLKGKRIIKFNLSEKNVKKPTGDQASDRYWLVYKAFKSNVWLALYSLAIFFDVKSPGLLALTTFRLPSVSPGLFLSVRIHRQKRSHAFYPSVYTRAHTHTHMHTLTPSPVKAKGDGPPLCHGGRVGLEPNSLMEDSLFLTLVNLSYAFTPSFPFSPNTEVINLCLPPWCLNLIVLTKSDTMIRFSLLRAENVCQIMRGIPMERVYPARAI